MFKKPGRSDVSHFLKCLVCDVDNTLLNLRDGEIASLLNGDLLIPILQFACHSGIFLAISTARTPTLDNDLTTSGTVNLADLLNFMHKQDVHFSESTPDLIIMNETAMHEREQLAQKYQPNSVEFEQFLKEKNTDLNLILQRLNANAAGETHFLPQDILILDDTLSVIEQAKKANYQALHVPLNFNLGAKNTVNVDYLLQLARYVGLEAFIEKMAHNNQNLDPKLLEIAQKFQLAKKQREKEIPQPIYIFPELLHLDQTLAEEPRKVIEILKQFKDRTNFSSLINKYWPQKQNNVTLYQTLLAIGIRKNNLSIVKNLLLLGANPNQGFDLDPNHLQIPPILAAIACACSLELILCLLPHANLHLLYAEKKVIEHLYFSDFIDKHVKSYLIHKDSKQFILSLFFEIDLKPFFEYLYSASIEEGLLQKLKGPQNEIIQKITAINLQLDTWKGVALFANINLVKEHSEKILTELHHLRIFFAGWFSLFMEDTEPEFLLKLLENVQSYLNKKEHSRNTLSQPIQELHVAVQNKIITLKKQELFTKQRRNSFLSAAKLSIHEPLKSSSLPSSPTFWHANNTPLSSLKEESSHNNEKKSRSMMTLNNSFS